MPLPPHQDPITQDDGQRVTIMEYVTTLIHQLDRRFDTLHADLKDSITQRFHDADLRYQQSFRDMDLRYQQRFDAQTKALDAALAAQKEAVITAMTASEKATSKAENAADKRFESVNEFRKTLSDQTGTFMPRSEAETRLTSMSEKIDDLKIIASQSSGRSAGLNAGWGYVLGAIGLVSAVIAIIGSR